MKIFIVAYKFGTEKEIGEHLGTYHYFIELLRRLVGLGHEVWVIAPWLSFFKKGSNEFSGIKIQRYYPPVWNKIWAFPLNRLLNWLYLKATQKQVLDCTKKHQPDLILVWQARETGYAIAKIKNKLKAPFIFRQITTWQWHFDRSIKEIFGKNGWYKFFESLKINYLIDHLVEFLLERQKEKNHALAIYQKADKVIFVSKIAAFEAEALGLKSEKTRILPVAIETDFFKPLNKKLELKKELGLIGDKIILFIGRINFAEKGIGYLVEALPKVLQSGIEATLVIVGGGEMARLEKLIIDLKIKNQVVLAGKQPFAELVKYINASDVFVVPSVWLETFGQVTIEAMACGVPVVTSDAGASPDINIDGQTGFVVPAKNSEKLAEAIVKLLKDDELREKMGRSARERVLNNYTYQATVDTLLNIINETQKTVETN